MANKKTPKTAPFGGGMVAVFQMPVTFAGVNERVCRGRSECQHGLLVRVGGELYGLISMLSELDLTVGTAHTLS